MDVANATDALSTSIEPQVAGSIEASTTASYDSPLLPALSFLDYFLIYLCGLCGVINIFQLEARSYFADVIGISCPRVSTGYPPSRIISVCVDDT